VLVQDRIYVSAQPAQMPQVYSLLTRFGEQAERWLTDGMIYPAFMTAVVEIATNIMRHAYPAEEVAGMLELTLLLYAGRLEAHFRDQGIEFHPPSPTAPSVDDPLNLPEGGFGLLAARQSVNVLDYRRTGDGDNLWTLVKEF
jgi:serine/threonine-protein kinase RsbW